MLTKEDPCDPSVCVVTVLLRHITHAEKVELLALSMARRVDGEQDGPGHQAAHEADGSCYLEVSEKKVCVQGLMVQNISIGNRDKLRNPIEQTAGQIGRTLA